MDHVAIAIVAGVLLLVGLPTMGMLAIFFFGGGHYLLALGMVLVAMMLIIIAASAIALFEDDNLRKIINTIGSEYRKALFSGNFQHAAALYKKGFMFAFKPSESGKYAVFNLMGLCLAPLVFITIFVGAMPLL